MDTLDAGWEETILQYIGSLSGRQCSSGAQLRANGLRYLRRQMSQCYVINLNRLTRGDFPAWTMLEGKRIRVELHKVDELRNLYVYAK